MAIFLVLEVTQNLDIQKKTKKKKLNDFEWPVESSDFQKMRIGIQQDTGNIQSHENRMVS